MAPPQEHAGDPSRSPASDELRVVLLARRGRDSQLMCDLLGTRDVVCAPVSSVGELIALIGEGCLAGTLVLADEAVSDTEAEALSRLLDAQPAWSDLPLLVLAPRESSGARLQDRLSRPGLHVLNRPLQPATFWAAVRSMLETRRRQYQVRDLLRDSRALNEQLERRARQLRRLSLQLGDAEERERRRLAVYVHDDLQQLLAGIMFHLEVTEDIIESWLDEPGNRAELAELDYIDPTEITRRTPDELPAMLGYGRRVFEQFAELCLR